MQEPEERLEQVMHRLRAQGYRLTPQRMAILQAVVESDTHPTAEEIHQQVLTDFPMISLATVYKTLHVLKRLGEVVELRMAGHSRYDSDTTPHPHLICVQCHSVVDLPSEAMVTVPDQVLAEMGFHPLWHHVEVYGLCARCYAQREKEVQR